MVTSYPILIMIRIKLVNLILFNHYYNKMEIGAISMGIKMMTRVSRDVNSYSFSNRFVGLFSNMLLLVYQD